MIQHTSPQLLKKVRRFNGLSNHSSVFPRLVTITALHVLAVRPVDRGQSQIAAAVGRASNQIEAEFTKNLFVPKGFRFSIQRSWIEIWDQKMAGLSFFKSSHFCRANGKFGQGLIRMDFRVQASTLKNPTTEAAPLSQKTWSLDLIGMMFTTGKSEKTGSCLFGCVPFASELDACRFTTGYGSLIDSS